jgi:hypothetical protein
MNRHKNDDLWKEAKRRCRLNVEDIRMAKELGFQPRTLIKNIPAPTQQWKTPVKFWIRELYEDKFGSLKAKAARSTVPPDPAPPWDLASAVDPTPGDDLELPPVLVAPPDWPSAPDPEPPPDLASMLDTEAPPDIAVGKRAAVIEFRNPDYPWPDRPAIPAFRSFDFPPEYGYCDDPAWETEFDYRRSFEPPSEEEIEDENGTLLRHQCLFRWAAQSIAVALSDVPEVRRVAAFGAVAQPLKMEVPRFREFRRHRIQVFHECADVDLAVWMTRVDKLQDLKRALQRGVAFVQGTAYGGVAHHQVDVHILDEGTDCYRGRLCFFSECPKRRKPECLVPGCGVAPFLRQFEEYHFEPLRFQAAPKVVLYDRPGRFLVHLPEVDPAPSIPRSPRIEDDEDDLDVPF